MSLDDDAAAFFDRSPPRSLGDAPEAVRAQIGAASHRERKLLVVGGAQLPVIALALALAVSVASDNAVLLVVMSLILASDTLFLWFAYTRWRRSLGPALDGEAHRGIVRGVETKRVRQGESHVELSEIFVSFAERDAERWCRVLASNTDVKTGAPATVLLDASNRRTLAVWTSGQLVRGKMVAKPHDIAEATADLGA